jgi:hypothetical protein
LVGARILFMGSRPPEFSPSDNPASDSPTVITRALTFLFLPAFNWWLLLCPSKLSFDWSMGSIPLVEGVSDVRNLATAAFYVGLMTAAWRVLLAVDAANRRTSVAAAPPSPDYRRKSTPQRNPITVNGNGYHEVQHINGTSSLSSSSVVNKTAAFINRSNGCCGVNGGVSTEIKHSLPTENGGSHRTRSLSHSRLRDTAAANDDVVAGGESDDVMAHGASWSPSPHVALVSLALLVVPFIPATNLFFYVGFVVAERVLYIPSLGLCLLVADGVCRLMSSSLSRCGVGGDPTTSTMRWRHWHWLCRHQRVVVRALFLVLLATMAVKTFARNADWLTEESLYRSGISVNPAKGQFCFHVHFTAFLMTSFCCVLQ